MPKRADSIEEREHHKLLIHYRGRLLADAEVGGEPLVEEVEAEDEREEAGRGANDGVARDAAGCSGFDGWILGPCLDTC